MFSQFMPLSLAKAKIGDECIGNNNYVHPMKRNGNMHQ
jgi:hypothetical protein